MTRILFTTTMLGVAGFWVLFLWLVLVWVRFVCAGWCVLRERGGFGLAGWWKGADGDGKVCEVVL